MAFNLNKFLSKEENWQSAIENCDNVSQYPIILNDYGVQWEEIKFNKTSVIVVQDGGLMIVDPNRISVQPAANWIWDIPDYRLGEYVTENDFNKEFWESARPGKLYYHGTQPQRLPEIQVK